MNCYCAPMEGLTGYLFRNAHHCFFGYVDQYYMPFIVPNQHHKFSARERQDICPEHNRDIKAVPQIMTNRAEDFIWTARELKAMGYDTVNLNLGCPSGTVVTKKRGSGFLACQEELNRFLDGICTKLDMKISVKTRIGKDSPEEFYELIQIYNRYPLHKLIIHPRIQKDFYKNTPNLGVFRDALKLSKNPVCYNGNIFSQKDWETFSTQFPEVSEVMLGRGIIANPALAGELKNQKPLDKQRLRAFHDQIYAGYQDILSGERNVLFRMKELWFYMGGVFADSGKYVKKIKKSERLADYEIAVASLFRERELLADCGYGEQAGLNGMA